MVVGYLAGRVGLCRAVIEAAPDGIVVTDEQGSIVLVNMALEVMFGYGRGELVGRPIEVLLRPADRGGHVRLRDRFARMPRRRPMAESRGLRGRKKDGSEVPLEIGLSPIEEEGARYTVAVVRDVTVRMEIENRLRYASTHDPLTGLYNRTFFEAEVERLRRGRDVVSTLMVDMDGLKEINDSQGHAAGDAMLKRLAVVLRSAFRGEDVVGRLGGDEFAVLLPGVDHAGMMTALARLQEELERHNDLCPGPPLRFSVGGATAQDGSGLRQALRLADASMYAEKRANGRARVSRAP